MHALCNVPEQREIRLIKLKNLTQNLRGNLAGPV